NRVERAARESVMTAVYENSFWGVIWSSILSRLMFSNPRFTEETDDHGRISRAGYYLKQDKLVECMDELHNISNEDARKVCKDWTSEVEKRLLANYALEIIKGQVHAMSQSQNVYSKNR